VFNEAESLAPLHAEICVVMAAIPAVAYEIIFVDDGSTDGSFAVMRALHAADPDRVRVIRFRRNFGQTAAMAAGFDAARGDVIIPMDADLQNDPADIPKLLSALEQGFDVYMITDASGDISDEAHERAVQRMIQAGARPVTSLQYLLELQRDWARTETYELTTGIAKVNGGAYGIGINYAKTMFHASEGGH
jgi:glycosyltransferase involved in cell wall biosynthesis